MIVNDKPQFTISDSFVYSNHALLLPQGLNFILSRLGWYEALEIDSFNSCEFILV